MQKATLVAVTLLFTIFIACKKTPEKIISINPTGFGVEEQIKVGDAFKREIERNQKVFKILENETYPEAYDYLSQIFYTLINTASVEHRQHFDWSIDIIQDDSMRTAFFLPGGHFYIYSGLLKYLESESQLLGVIGHELYYVDSEILIKRMSAEFGGTTLGDILLENEVENLDQLAMAMPYLLIEDEYVMNADSFSVHLICPFQYEPHGIKNVIEKTGHDPSILLWLATRQSNHFARILSIERQAVVCGLPGINNEESYQRFVKEYLP